VRFAESLEIHHTRRDGDWLTPESLRKILRLTISLVTDQGDPWEDLASD